MLKVRSGFSTQKVVKEEKYDARKEKDMMNKNGPVITVIIWMLGDIQHLLN